MNRQNSNSGVSTLARQLAEQVIAISALKDRLDSLKTQSEASSAAFTTQLAGVGEIIKTLSARLDDVES